MADSLAAGQRLGLGLAEGELAAGLVFAPGVGINGSALIEGMVQQLGGHVPLAGGLAADGGMFERTLTLTPEGVMEHGVVAIGLYGSELVFAHGSFGGWEPFGPARRVTRCRENVLFELDGESALTIYKRYLGEYARDLPASGLLFPFAMVGEDRKASGLIRTILGVDESTGSLVLAGDIDPQGYLRLMHANTDGLVNGAEKAAEAACRALAGTRDGLALLVSCVGRKLVMGERVDEEIEAVAAVFGREATVAGFYSNGEISPFTPGLECKLHNQTMTVDYISEG